MVNETWILGWFEGDIVYINIKCMLQRWAEKNGWEQGRTYVIEKWRHNGGYWNSWNVFAQISLFDFHVRRIYVFEWHDVARLRFFCTLLLLVDVHTDIHSNQLPRQIHWDFKLGPRFTLAFPLNWCVAYWRVYRGCMCPCRCGCGCLCTHCMYQENVICWKFLVTLRASDHLIQHGTIYSFKIAHLLAPLFHHYVRWLCAIFYF